MQHVINAVGIFTLALLAVALGGFFAFGLIVIFQEWRQCRRCRRVVLRQSRNLFATRK